MPVTERQERPPIILPAWETVIGIITLMTANNRRNISFVKTHREQLKDFYDGLFDMAAGHGEKKLDTLIWQYTNKESLTYNPKLLRKLNPYVSIIASKF